jgi:hypothetical protein
MDEQRSALEEATNRVLELEAELEAAGNATTEGDAIVRLRAILHDWVDTVTAVVTTPGVGRAVLIHADGSESRIASPKLPALLSAPVKWE